MKTKLLARHVAALALPALLVACGGGGGSSATTPTPTVLSISGTAATGAAIVGGTVDVKCAVGTGTATSNSTGGYTVSVTSGSLPCLLKVTQADGSTLFSVATGSGSTAVANINPVTQLVIASLSGTDPAAYFAGFDSAAAAAVTPTKVDDAVGTVKTTLLAAGIDLSSTDVLSGTLTPATATTTGDAYDQALDALAVKLTSTGTTLADLTTTVAATSPAATASTSTPTSSVASLPADLLLKPAASNCPALRSATYRIVTPDAGKTLSAQFGKVTIDASTLALVYSNGSTDTWVANGACRFLGNGGTSDIVVSQAGVAVVRYLDAATGTYKLAFGFPEQAHTLAELEGSWNTAGLQYDPTSAAYIGSAATGTFGADGSLSSVSVCEDAATWSVASCVTVTSGLPSFRINVDGGFDVVDPDTTVNGRTFAYRSGSGDLMMMHVDGDGSFEVRTRQRSNELPAVGLVRTNWDLILNNKLLAPPALSQSMNTITAIDATTSSFTRLAKTVGGTDEHYETVDANSPRDGYSFRPAATVTGTDGVTVVQVREWTNLGLRGMGLNALIRPTQKQLAFSVQQAP